ncbi:uncharacterized protein LOC143290891 [Babylonia areolata]|uniref:uncharacterized protein LOC143290891 n=1 Tax=Babylonia areolata TaxID=304850 RepID=UPI003FD336FD
MWTTTVTVFVCIIVFQVRGDNCPYDGELTARSTSSVTIFNQSLQDPYDRIFESYSGLECSWKIEASDASKRVRLYFETFHLQNATSSHNGDCVAIYDGEYIWDGQDNLVQELCNRMPELMYNSTDKYLTVVFRQGGQGGRRWFSMNYTMVSAPDDNGDGFWSTTFGRILSFLIVIAIFSIFSFVFKAGRHGSLSDTCSGLCGFLGHCVRRVLGPGSRPSSQSTSQAVEGEDANTDIVTISGSNGSTPAPNLSFLSADPAPDYTTVMARSASVSTLSEISDSVRPDEEDAAPDYDSVISQSFHSHGQDLSQEPTLCPPPDDDSAPPSYELPAPPSYDSLFNSSSV